MIMRVMQPIPSFMGLETIHYVGGAALFFRLAIMALGGGNFAPAMVKTI
jgi:hypothetical protein